MSYRQARYDLRLIQEMKGRSDFSLPPVEEYDIPEGLRRASLDIPNLEENEVVRHYTNLSQMNYGVDNGLYPLGSCTMKYNPSMPTSCPPFPPWRTCTPTRTRTGCRAASA